MPEERETQEIIAIQGATRFAVANDPPGQTGGLWGKSTHRPHSSQWALTEKNKKNVSEGDQYEQRESKLRTEPPPRIPPHPVFPICFCTPQPPEVALRV